MTAKPTTITAAEFIDIGYAAKIAAGECVVNHHFPMDLFKVTDVYEMPFRSKVTGTNLRIEYVDIDDDPCDILPDEQLTVTWLPQADAKPDSGATGEVRGLALEWVFGFDGALACLELVANGSTWQSWQQHRTDTRGIVTERAGKYLRKQQAELANAKAEAEALRTALEAIANKSDPEKPIRLDGETGTSYGRTYGQWEMAKIAREALQAGTEGG